MKNALSLCLQWAFRWPLPRFVSWISVATRALPASVLKMLFSDWPDAQLIVLRRLLNSPSAIYAALSMAHEEMQTIKELDIDLLMDNKDKIHMYFTELDQWVGENKAAILAEFDPGEDNVKIVHGPEDIPHAFCIST